MLMNVLDLKRFEQIEEIVETVHKAFPHLPKKPRRLLTESVPYIAFFIAIAIGIAALLPLFNISTPIFNKEQIFTINNYLLQAVLLLCSFILVTSFKPLSLWMKKGWYILFYASLIQLLLTLMYFNIYTLSAQVAAWYVLFEIKKEYS